MKNRGKARLIVLVVVVIAALGFYLYSERAGPPPEAPEVEPVQPAPPPVRHPVPEPAPSPEPVEPHPDDAPDFPRIPEPERAPGLDRSDEIIRHALTEMLGEVRVEALLADDQIVPRLVLAIDSLDRKAIPLRMRPVVHVPGLPEIDEEDDRKFLAGANSARYRAHMDALAAIDLDELVEMYFKHYAWFQEVYAELGYPEGYFNDRMVDIIDHLLETPEPAWPLELTRPEVLYEFADPELEAASWGRKILFRVGPEHAAEIKDWLRRLRARIAPD